LAAKIKVDMAIPRKIAFKSPTENAMTTRNGVTIHSTLDLVLRKDPTTHVRNISSPANTKRHEKAGLGIY
jgi:hypothetical protein